MPTLLLGVYSLRTSGLAAGLAAGTCALVAVAAMGLAACSSSSSGSADCSGSAVACGAPITDVGSAITPMCSTATPPAAVGGTYADGTYVLTAETFYQSGSNC